MLLKSEVHAIKYSDQILCHQVIITLIGFIQSIGGQLSTFGPCVTKCALILSPLRNTCSILKMRHTCSQETRILLAPTCTFLNIDL